MCEERGICYKPIFDGNVKVPMATKERVWATKQQQVCRIDTEDTRSPDKTNEARYILLIQDEIEKHRPKCVIISDYSKGFITDGLIQNVSRFCRDRKIPTILDPKRPSFPKMRNLTIVKPNSREVAITNMNVETISNEMQDTLVVNTLGKDGLVVYQDGQYLFGIPTMAKPEEVTDVTSAGDGCAAMLGIGLYMGLDIKTCAIAANKAAYFIVKQLGTYVLKAEEIKDCIEYAKQNRH